MGDFSILVVDDQQIQRDTLAEILREHSFHVKTARDFPEACQLLDAQIFDIILTDFRIRSHRTFKNILLKFGKLTRQHDPFQYCQQRGGLLTPFARNLLQGVSNVTLMTWV